MKSRAHAGVLVNDDRPPQEFVYGWVYTIRTGNPSWVPGTLRQIDVLPHPPRSFPLP